MSYPPANTQTSPIYQIISQQQSTSTMLTANPTAISGSPCPPPPGATLVAVNGLFPPPVVPHTIVSVGGQTTSVANTAQLQPNLTSNGSPLFFPQTNPPTFSATGPPGLPFGSSATSFQPSLLPFFTPTGLLTNASPVPSSIYHPHSLTISPTAAGFPLLQPQQQLLPLNPTQTPILSPLLTPIQPLTNSLTTAPIPSSGTMLLPSLPTVISCQPSSTTIVSSTSVVVSMGGENKTVIVPSSSASFDTSTTLATSSLPLTTPVAGDKSKSDQPPTSQPPLIPSSTSAISRRCSPSEMLALEAVDFHRDAILNAIDRLRDRKARPDLERISCMLKRYHNINPDKTQLCLRRLADAGAVVCVDYKGNLSYRNPTKWRKTTIGGSGSGSSTSNSYVVTVRLVEALRRLQQGTVLTKISDGQSEEQLTPPLTIQPGPNGGFSVFQIHRALQLVNTLFNSTEGPHKTCPELTGATLRVCLDREATYGRLAKTADGRYVLDETGERKRQAGLMATQRPPPLLAKKPPQQQPVLLPASLPPASTSKSCNASSLDQFTSRLTPIAIKQQPVYTTKPHLMHLYSPPLFNTASIRRGRPPGSKRTTTVNGSGGGQPAEKKSKLTVSNQSNATTTSMTTDSATSEVVIALSPANSTPSSTFTSPVKQPPESTASIENGEETVQGDDDDDEELPQKSTTSSSTCHYCGLVEVKDGCDQFLVCKDCGQCDITFHPTDHHLIYHHQCGSSDLYVCDACDKGFHAECLQSSNSQQPIELSPDRSLPWVCTGCQEEGYRVAIGTLPTSATSTIITTTTNNNNETSKDDVVIEQSDNDLVNDKMNKENIALPTSPNHNQSPLQSKSQAINEDKSRDVVDNGLCDDNDGDDVVRKSSKKKNKNDKPVDDNCTATVDKKPRSSLNDEKDRHNSESLYPLEGSVKSEPTESSTTVKPRQEVAVKLTNGHTAAVSTTCSTPSSFPEDTSSSTHSTTAPAAGGQSVLPSDLQLWSVGQVKNWLLDQGFVRESELFAEQEIDGASLVLVQNMTLLTELGIKLGPAVKIFQRIKRLQSINNCPT